MKRYLAFAAMAALFACISTAEEDPEAYQSIKIAPVFSKLITRGKDDRVYSGQIKTKEGLAEFQKAYGIEINTVQMDFSKQMLIFGVTDNITTRAVQFLKQERMRSFTLDYADTGIKYRLRRVGEGLKYSYLQVFLLDRIDGISHIKVKNLIENGLSTMYDK